MPTDLLETWELILISDSSFAVGTNRGHRGEQTEKQLYNNYDW